MLYVIGYPDDCGGANVELFATVKLWRAHGVDLTLIPTWSAPAAWEEQLDAIGAKTILAYRQAICQTVVPIPPDSTVISFGNHHFLDMATELKERGCRLIYVPCEAEPQEAVTQPIDEWVFQSHYQYFMWAEAIPTDASCHIIPGAFDPADFPFNPLPHKPGEPFVCGRISRPDVRKFSPDLWDAYRDVPNIRARIMGWSGTIEAHCGKPPEWATVLRKRSEPAREFYGKLHAIIHPGGEAAENWPRFVLEAMAAGVPVITDNRGGTREMICHRLGGFLCETLSEMCESATTLAQHECVRQGVAKHARQTVERLSDPEAIWAKWEPLIGG